MYHPGKERKSNKAWNDKGGNGYWLQWEGGADRTQGVCSLKANPGYDMNKTTDIVWDYHLHYCLWQEQQNNKVTQLCNTTSSGITLLYSFVWFLAYSTKKWPSTQYLVAIFHIKGMAEISVPGLCIPIGSYSVHLCNSEELGKKTTP